MKVLDVDKHSGQIIWCVGTLQGCQSLCQIVRGQQEYEAEGSRGFFAFDQIKANSTKLGEGQHGQASQALLLHFFLRIEACGDMTVNHIGCGTGNHCLLQQKMIKSVAFQQGVHKILYVCQFQSNHLVPSDNPILPIWRNGVK